MDAAAADSKRDVNEKAKKTENVRPDWVAAADWSKVPNIVGSSVTARDKCLVWYEGIIKDAQTDAVKVHYQGWSDSSDEWIPRAESDRLVMTGTLSLDHYEPDTILHVKSLFSIEEMKQARLAAGKIATIATLRQRLTAQVRQEGLRSKALDKNMDRREMMKMGLGLPDIFVVYERQVSKLRGLWQEATQDVPTLMQQLEAAQEQVQRAKADQKQQEEQAAHDLQRLELEVERAKQEKKQAAEVAEQAAQELRAAQASHCLDLQAVKDQHELRDLVASQQVDRLMLEKGQVEEALGQCKMDQHRLEQLLRAREHREMQQADDEKLLEQELPELHALWKTQEILAKSLAMAARLYRDKTSEAKAQQAALDQWRDALPDLAAFEQGQEAEAKNGADSKGPEEEEQREDEKNKDAQQQEEEGDDKLKDWASLEKHLHQILPANDCHTAVMDKLVAALAKVALPVKLQRAMARGLVPVAEHVYDVVNAEAEEQMMTTTVAAHDGCEALAAAIAKVRDEQQRDVDVDDVLALEQRQLAEAQQALQLNRQTRDALVLRQEQEDGLLSQAQTVITSSLDQYETLWQTRHDDCTAKRNGVAEQVQQVEALVASKLQELMDRQDKVYPPLDGSLGGLGFLPQLQEHMVDEWTSQVVKNALQLKQLAHERRLWMTGQQQLVEQTLNKRLAGWQAKVDEAVEALHLGTMVDEALHMALDAVQRVTEERRVRRQERRVALEHKVVALVTQLYTALALHQFRLEGKNKEDQETIKKLTNQRALARRLNQRDLVKTLETQLLQMERDLRADAKQMSVWAAEQAALYPGEQDETVAIFERCGCPCPHAAAKEAVEAEMRHVEELRQLVAASKRSKKRLAAGSGDAKKQHQHLVHKENSLLLSSSSTSCNSQLQPNGEGEAAIPRVSDKTMNEEESKNQQSLANPSQVSSSTKESNPQEKAMMEHAQHEARSGAESHDEDSDNPLSPPKHPKPRRLSASSVTSEGWQLDMASD